VIATAIKAGGVGRFLSDVERIREAVLVVRDALTVVAARGVDVRAVPDAQMFFAPEREVAYAIRALYASDSAARKIMERHTGREDLQTIYHDVLSTGRELRMPRLAALEPFVEAFSVEWRNRARTPVMTGWCSRTRCSTSRFCVRREAPLTVVPTAVSASRPAGASTPAIWAARTASGPQRGGPPRASAARPRRRAAGNGAPGLLARVELLPHRRGWCCCARRWTQLPPTRPTARLRRLSQRSAAAAPTVLSACCNARICGDSCPRPRTPHRTRHFASPETPGSIGDPKVKLTIGTYAFQLRGSRR
jgi:hypothetical protein